MKGFDNNTPNLNALLPVITVLIRAVKFRSKLIKSHYAAHISKLYIAKFQVILIPAPAAKSKTGFYCSRKQLR